MLIQFLAALLIAAPSPYEGVTEPIQEAVVGSTVSGKIKAVVAPEGARVRKGKVVLLLEDDEEEINVAITGVVADDTSDVVSTRQKRLTFERDYLATKRLFESSNSVSEEQLWEKELSFRTADAELAKALAMSEKERLENGMAKAQLEKRILRAPFDGVVVKHRKRIAESVQALEPLFDIVDVRRCRFTTYVVANLAQSFRKGQVVTLQLDGGAAPRERKGTIDFISPVVDKASMLRVVKVVFDNGDGSIEPGVTGRILVK